MKRTHRFYEPIYAALSPERVASIAGPQRLVAARFEPTIRQSSGAGFLDLVFADDTGAIAIVPLVYVDHAMLIEPEDDVLVWPRRLTAGIDQDVLSDTAAAVYPWLYSLSVAHVLDRESTHVFSQAFHETFAAARDSGFLGAAPYALALGAAAPAHHALRFSGKHVGIAAENTSSVAARAEHVTVDLCDRERNALANRWYGVECFRTISPDERFDVWVSPQVALRDASVQIVTDAVPEGFTPVAGDSLSPVNTARGAVFGVRAKPVEVRDPIVDATTSAVGGSSGRIALSGRSSLFRIPDADTDDVLELAQRLRAEGFIVDFVRGGDDLAQFDLVHVYGLLDAGEAVAVLQAAKGAGKPSVLTASLEDLCGLGVWGAAVSQSLFATTLDENEIDGYLGHLAAHTLSTPEMKAGERYEPHAGFQELVRNAMALADVVLTSSPAEERLLRERYGRRSAFAQAGPYLTAGGEPEATPELTGDRDFALCHAPIEPRCNQLLVARAAREAGLPIVFAGPVADSPFAELVRESAGEGALYMPSATPTQIAALYRRARVFIDAAWTGTGWHRLARAAACGSALVAGASRYAASEWPGALWQVDPASIPSIATGLQEAWAGAGSRVPDLSPGPAAFVATVAAYAEAQAANLNSSHRRADILR